MNQKRTITIESIVYVPKEKAWEFWTKPEHIVQWAFASDDWEVPAAENDLRVGGKFKTVMGAKDKSSQFDFTGVYTNVKEHQLIEYTLEDGRQVSLKFEGMDGATKITETFEPFPAYTEEQERSGWQAVLENFKKYADSHK